MRAHRSAHYWPTAEQTELLRAALLSREPALAAWARWKATANLDRLDAGSERLLPLLAHNLRRCGVRDLQLGRHDRLLHYTWATNQRRIARILPVIRALHLAQVPAMLLKGMALARHHYEHPGLRPMDDVDLLVPAAHAHRATEILQELGWRPAAPDADPAALHSRSFEAVDGWPIDLHWRALWEAIGPASDDELWARAVQASLGGTPLWILSPADLFLQVVVHGARWNPVPPVRWVADAMAILSSAAEAFDWALLVSQAKAHALVLPIREALAFLVETFGAPVPSGVQTELEAYRSSTFERVEQRMREWTSPRIGCFPLVLCHHVRLTRAEGLAAVVWGFPRYLQRAYGLPSLGAVPAALWLRAARRQRPPTSRPDDPANPNAAGASPAREPTAEGPRPLPSPAHTRESPARRR